MRREAQAALDLRPMLRLSTCAAGEWPGTSLLLCTLIVRWTATSSHVSECLVVGFVHPAQGWPGRHRVCARSAPDQVAHQTDPAGALAIVGVRQRSGHRHRGAAVTDQRVQQQPCSTPALFSMHIPQHRLRRCALLERSDYGCVASGGVELDDLHELVVARLVRIDATRSPMRAARPPSR
jgi:hypothetical protein